MESAWNITRSIIRQNRWCSKWFQLQLCIAP